MNSSKLKDTDRNIRLSELITKQIEPVQDSGNFFAVRQSKATNSLAETLTSKITNPAQIDLLGNGKIESKDFILFIKGYNELAKGIGSSAVKLLDMLVMAATQTGQTDTLISMPLKEYMVTRGLRDEKEARAQIKRDIDALERVRFEYREKKRGRAGDWLNVTLAGGTSGIKNGVIFFRFNEDFFKCLPEKQFMYLPKEAFTFNDKYNPHSYFFLRRIALHKRMNLGKSNEDIISVQTLINSSPRFPSYDEIREGAGQISLRIIEPFERDLDAIKIIKWEYTDQQPATYKDFIDSNIKITWETYPDVKLFLENKRKPTTKKTKTKPKETE